MSTKLMIAVCMLMASGTAVSQMTPQMQQQLPPSDPSSSQYNSVYLPSLGQGDTVRPDPRGRWEDRWGAIAADAKKGKIGTAVDVASKRMAERMALAACKGDGGTDCRIKITYTNQCVAMVVGKVGYGTSHAATESEAEMLGLSDCKAKDKECSVYYSGCSLPERMQ